MEGRSYSTKKGKGYIYIAGVIIILIAVLIVMGIKPFEDKAELALKGFIDAVGSGNYDKFMKLSSEDLVVRFGIASLEISNEEKSIGFSAIAGMLRMAIGEDWYKDYSYERVDGATDRPTFRVDFGRIKLSFRLKKEGGDYKVYSILPSL